MAWQSVGDGPMIKSSREQIIRQLATEFLRATKQRPQPASKPSIWQRVPDALDLWRKITINVVVILIGGILIAVTLKATFEPLVVFETIRLPPELATSGYGANVLADRVLDRMHEINRGTSATKELMSFSISPRSETVSDRMSFGATSHYEALSTIQVPSSNLSLRSVVLLLRNLFKPDDVRVAGDLTIVTSPKANGTAEAKPSPASDVLQKAVDKTTSDAPVEQVAPASLYVLQLRYTRGDRRQFRTVSDAELDKLVVKAAEAILDLSDPYILASHHYARGAWPDVDGILGRVLEAGRNYAEATWALNLRGMRMLDLERHAEAIDHFEQVARLDAEGSAFYDRLLNPSKHRQRAIPYTNWGNALRKMEDYDGAVRMYARAAEFDPNYVLAFYNWGSALQARRSYDEAAEKYRQATEIDPKYAPAFNNWGTTLRSKRDYWGAIAKYKRALELNPKYTLALNNWGVALRHMEDYDGAIEKFKRVMEIDPRNAIAMNSWGVVLFQKGDRKAAIERYQQAIALDPRYAAALNNWGNILSEDKQYKEAIEKYERALEIDPKYALGFYNLGLALARMTDYDGAIAKYERATQLDRKYASAFNNWGVALRQKGDHDGALEKYKRAIDVDPEYITAYHNVANVLEFKGKSTEADEMRRRAGELEARALKPDRAGAH
jgi:tetratricopeptide (TPR) repeat protein